MSWWWGVPWILPLALFCGKAVVICRDASPNARRWQNARELPHPTSDGGNISPRCVPGRSAMAIFRPGAFLGGNPWQVSRSMYPERGPGREKRPFMATYRRYASKMSWRWQDMRAMYPKSHANRLSGMHSARILPGRGPFRCTGPSNHAWRANPAIPPAPPNSASTAAPVSAPSALSPSRWFATLPASNRQAAFPERGASLAPVVIKVAVAFRLPYLWRLTVPVFCALDSRDRHINARQSPFYAFISLWLRKNRLPSGKTQALPIQWVGCSRGHVPYRTINKEKRLRWQLLHIALSARKRRKW